MEGTYTFIEKLSTKEPVPGGGGASALMGAVSAALCSMVANLTSGKKKYAEYQEDVERILADMQREASACLKLMEEDAKAFLPLSRAYGIPKDQPGRDEILENALKNACQVPFDILKEAHKILGTVQELRIKGSRLAVSDVGVAASACRSAAEGAAMNVFINTKLMKDREYAERVNLETKKMLEECVTQCSRVYDEIMAQLCKRA